MSFIRTNRQFDEGFWPAVAIFFFSQTKEGSNSFGKPSTNDDLPPLIVIIDTELVFNLYIGILKRIGRERRVLSCQRDNVFHIYLLCSVYMYKVFAMDVVSLLPFIGRKVVFTFGT